jgi:uncharacterized membrane protein YhaH (DUF805 family)
MATAPAQREPTILWALFALDGRVSREVFWLGNFMAGFVNVGLAVNFNHPSGVPVLSPIWPVLFIPLLWVEIALTVKRLHDRSLNGWFAVLLAVPVVGIFAFVVIGLLPGTRGANLYGPGPNRRGRL